MSFKKDKKCIICNNLIKKNKYKCIKCLEYYHFKCYFKFKIIGKINILACPNCQENAFIVVKKLIN